MHLETWELENISASLLLRVSALRRVVAGLRILCALAVTRAVRQSVVLAGIQSLLKVVVEIGEQITKIAA
jgi:hypothetical protein